MLYKWTPVKNIQLFRKWQQLKWTAETEKYKQMAELCETTAKKELFELKFVDRQSTRKLSKMEHLTCKGRKPSILDSERDKESTSITRL